MNAQDREAFENHLDEKIGSTITRRKFYGGEGSGTVAAARTAWQAALEYRDNESIEWKEAARSEAKMLTEERVRSKILVSALEDIIREEDDIPCYHVELMEEALKKYRGEQC